ncbi:zinc-binding oxidoreductase [Purpureocillium lavendulum]|uniref:Zinc-binding oxidoreductase n=1 Tax=Purpureocillium lavendulum TaxID=1247861 RepID=A0AB34FU39_9HYPO|nr:zinc-binding oxidoreductase [Purpureocillium lavendulum]
MLNVQLVWMDASTHGGRLLVLLEVWYNRSSLLRLPIVDTRGPRMSSQRQQGRGPAVQSAVIIQSPGRAALVRDWPIPPLREGYVRIRTVAVAVNPCDWKQVDGLGSPGTLLGCDYAGVVEEVGPGVRKPLKKGDRVCGMAHGANTTFPEDGAFAETIIAKADVQMRMPDHLGFEDAATLGVGVATVALGMYRNLDLALPARQAAGDTSILVYGGSTATGVMAVQFAKLSGYHVYATCSPSNFDLVRGFGADVVLDYHDADACAERIRQLSDNALTLVFDCISDEASARFCLAAMSTWGGEYSHINGLASVSFPKNVRASFAGAFTVFGEGFYYGDAWYGPEPGDQLLMENVAWLAEDLLLSRALRPHRATVGRGGLRGVLDGMDRLRHGRVSGEKLVYRVDSRPACKL